MIARRLTTNDIVLLCVLALICILAGILDFILSKRFEILPAALVLIVLCGIDLLLEMRRKILVYGEEQIQQKAKDFRNLESLVGVYAFLSPSIPLPHTGGWASSADFLKLIVEVCVRNRPIHILEASSGLSTLVCAYALKRLGINGKVFSLEHDVNFAEKTQCLVDKHGLQAFVTIIHAPLMDYVCCGDRTPWYDISKLPSNISIDLFVVDGPPMNIRRDIRKPAIPLLVNRISEGGVILLDDADRVGEQEIIKQWIRDYPELKYEHFANDKGAALFSKCKI